MNKQYLQLKRWVAGFMVIILTLALLPACTDHQLDPEDPAPEGLGFEFLQNDAPMLSPQSTQVFVPAGKLVPPSNNFEGVLTLDAGNSSSRIEVLTDTFGVVADENLKVTELPPFSTHFVANGTDLIPLEREPQRTSHPSWEIIIGPGKTWDLTDDGDWSRAALPFTLKEKNQNCLHNGLMTFLYKSDGSTSRAAWQIASETCLYFKANLWGKASVVFEPQTIATSAETITTYREELSNRLPVKPVSDLPLDHPGLEATAFLPPGVDDTTVFGFVMDGIHYRSDCPTRYGPYPFCEVLDLPSYSLAKSILGSLAYQLTIKRWPEFATIPVSSLIPECNTPDERWNDVFPVHLLNMTTGNYDAYAVNADEDAAKMEAFFLAESHDDKVRFSCEAWPRKSNPGAQWAYHTTDTYLLGVALNVFIQQKLGPQADIYRDLLYPEIFGQLELGPLMRWTQRTYDQTSQPFTGYGLIMHADDVIRLARALNSVRLFGQYLDAVDFDTAVARPGSSAAAMYDSKNTAYHYGFWGVDTSRWMACQENTWIPFMSGYGGITVVMFPGGGIYYYFTDSNRHGFRNAAVEANKVLNYCKE